MDKILAAIALGAVVMTATACSDDSSAKACVNERFCVYFTTDLPNESPKCNSDKTFIDALKQQYIDNGTFIREEAKCFDN